MTSEYYFTTDWLRTGDLVKRLCRSTWR